MIVKDKIATINKANELSSKIITLILAESKLFNCDDDPAEQVYLVIHTLGILLAKICISLQEYGRTYDIGMDYKSVKEWINLIADENIKLNIKEKI